MELSQLRTFCLAATEKSFSKAAQKLHLTQPAVTLQIKNLEAEIGEALFERLGRSIILTPAGETLLSFAQPLLNLADQALDTVRQFTNQRGRLTIGAGSTTTIYRLPDLLQQYHRACPQVEIRIRNGDSELISGLVSENAVDLGLVTTINNLPTFIRTIPLFKDGIWLVAPPNYPSQITPSRLAAESLILYRAGSGFRRYLEDQFHKYRFTPRVTMELESIEATIRLVRSGLGLAFLPEIAVKEELANGLLKTVKVKGWNQMSRQTYLILRQDKYLTWPIKAFLDLTRELPKIDAARKTRATI
ncbi:MAG: LysR family transcriptional regulator [Firmicutes bacterium]|nr:LysR family transcriptional regulator [Bacillota bacterium]